MLKLRCKKKVKQQKKEQQVGSASRGWLRKGGVQGAKDKGSWQQEKKLPKMSLRCLCRLTLRAPPRH
jgi:hypothetical protein